MNKSQTAQAEHALQLQKQFLPIQPREDDVKVKLILIHYYINPGSLRHLGDAIWAMPFVVAVWALPFGRFRKVLYYRQKILII